MSRRAILECADLAQWEADRLAQQANPHWAALTVIFGTPSPLEQVIRNHNDIVAWWWKHSKTECEI